MKADFPAACVAIVLLLANAYQARADVVGPPKPPTIPADVKGRDGVKTYLLAIVDTINAASADLKRAATEYAALINVNGGSAVAAAAAKPAEVAELVRRMRDAYQRIDSYGFEYVEGIVAGVPSLSKYDVELDSGLPATGAGQQDEVAPVVIKAGAASLDREGSLNNFLIEPTVFGTNPKFLSGTAKLPGFDAPVGLPNPLLLTGLADYAVDGYARLTRDAAAWVPSDADCFAVLANMTPTLADYFDEWKETKKEAGAAGGRFVAVSRVSDMRGIMSSTRLAWLAVRDGVKAKDAPLAESVTRGYDEILQFVDSVDAREQKQKMNVESIDALGTQAKEKADKLTVQAAQAATIVGAGEKK